MTDAANKSRVFCSKQIKYESFSFVNCGYMWMSRLENRTIPKYRRVRPRMYTEPRASPATVSAQTPS